MRPALFLLVVSAVLFLGSTQLFADTACHDAIRAKVIQNNPQVEKVTFDEASEKSEHYAKDTDTVTGKGQYLRHTGKYEDITWTCSLDTKNNKARTADYSVVQDGNPTREADVTKGWAKDCQDALRVQVQADHPNAEKTVFKNALESEASNGEKLLEGEGFFQRKDGEKKEFTYTCAYNTRTEKIKDKSYTLK